MEFPSAESLVDIEVLVKHPFIAGPVTNDTLSLTRLSQVMGYPLARSEVTVVGSNKIIFYLHAR